LGRIELGAGSARPSWPLGQTHDEMDETTENPKMQIRQERAEVAAVGRQNG
jgi:hypothetical protein